jgi:hypothetical protein
MDQMLADKKYFRRPSTNWKELFRSKINKFFQLLFVLKIACYRMFCSATGECRFDCLLKPGGSWWLYVELERVLICGRPARRKRFLKKIGT